MRRSITLLLALCLLAGALPVAAQAATSYTVRGGGYGHGIGMSQYGAQGFALQGRSYQEILRHYYTGTELGRANTKIIRVLLKSGGTQSFSGARQIVGQRELDPARTYVVRRSGAGTEVRSTRGTLIGRYAGVLRVTGQGKPVRLGGTAINGVSRGTYRGALEFRPSGSGLMAVNAASLDDYVQGVVPGEVPTSWHRETLRAQSVAARSYALTTDRGGVAFDQYPDTRSQVYRGVVAEQASTNAAVRATAGEVLRYDGKIAVTYFFSTSGGRTENIENSWPGATPQPYLKSVADPFDNISPRHRWRFNFTRGQMNAKLSGVLKGSYKGIKVVKRGVSPRIVSADVIGTRGRTRVTGPTLRWRLGLYDTWATFGSVSTSGRSRVTTSRQGVSAGGPRRTSGTEGVTQTRAVVGSISPVPAGRVFTVQKRTSGGAWRALQRATTDAAGRYDVLVSSSGSYRVVADGFAGPAARIR